ncbi:MAG: hypothetical protein H0X30_01595 [Anaerolineae bacterium]|nr:hypothetical protein [Anaerolineae bacterium]
MGQLIVSEPLASRIRAIARQQKRPEAELLADLVERYEPKGDPRHLPPRPAESLTDADIELPPDTTEPTDVEQYRAAIRSLRPKLYRIARRYWLKVGDTERLALTDEELDKVFWLIDHEGIPRFKSEKDDVHLPPDPLETLVNLFADSKVTDASTSVRETMARKYGRPD